MNKGELVASIAEAGGMTKVKAQLVLDWMLGTMTDAMEQGERVSLSGFGTFSIVDRSAQKGRNPQTGQVIEIPERKVVKFKPGKNLYSRVQDQDI